MRGRSRGEARISQDREAAAMSQATYSSEGYADADLVARLRAGDEAAVAAPDELAQGPIGDRYVPSRGS